MHDPAHMNSSHPSTLQIRGFYVLPLSCCSLDQLHRHLLKRCESVRRKTLAFGFTRSFSVSQPRAAEPPKPKMKDGKPVEVFTYFFYVPGHPNVVVVDLDKPLDKQP